MQIDCYDELLKYAQYLLRLKPHLSPYDVVQDAFMEILERGKDIDVLAAKKVVAKYANIDTTLSKLRRVDFAKGYTEKVCAGCKEVLPAAAFYIFGNKSKTGSRVLSARCKKCHTKACIEHQQKNRSYCNERFKKWAKDNKKKWNFYNRKRDQNQKSELTDAYIRKQLRHKYSTDFLKLPDNYHLIQSYREIKIAERSKKKVKL